MANAYTRNPESTGIHSRLRLALLGLAASVIAACGGGSAVSSITQPASCSDCGTALLTVTDAAGDFMSYTVDVTSLQLKTANGTVVQTLPATSRIDFAQLVDLSEVLSAGQIPVGDYVSATLGVDFTNSDIVVDDGTGTGVQVMPVDANNQALGAVQLTVQLDNRNHFKIKRKSISHLAFDLNLAASNTVSLTSKTVTVSPFIVATVQPVESRQVRARGHLNSVDTAGSTYTIDVRPFHEDSTSTGQMVIKTTSATRFEINGMVFNGADGLSQLSMLTNNPVTIAFGSIDPTDGSFTAQRVLAATSAQDLRMDYMSGNVLSRSDTALTVAGSSIEHRSGHDHDGYEMGPVTVTIGPNTLVTRDGQDSGTLTIADISVGQRVEVYGNLTRDASGNATIDATAGRVRLNYTRVSGSVTVNAPGALTVNLQAIDGRDPARYDFTGTGKTPTDDADPTKYQVSTGTLDITTLLPGAFTKLYGFVTPFGSAHPDFNAETYLDFTATRAELALSWGKTGATAPFSTTSDSALTLDMAATPHGGISLGRALINVTSLAGLQVVPATSGTLTLAIAHRSSHMVDNFSSFADFVAALNTDLNGTTPMLGLFGDGNFDAAGASFTATRVLVVLGD